MITKTIGSGGDYPTIIDAWIAIAPSWPSPALLDNYEFLITSDLTEKYLLTFQNTYRATLNGFTVSFVNSGKYKITIPNLVRYSFISEGNNGGHIVWDGLIFELPYNYGGNALLSFLGSGINEHSITYKNLCFLGGGVSSSVLSQAISLYDGTSIGWAQQIRRVVNCRFYGVGTAIGSDITGGGSVDIENSAIFNCNYGINIDQKNTSINLNIKNTVCLNTLYDGFIIKTNPANAVITNCADSDNSIASSGAILSGNITGITDLDFLSVDPASADFLKIGKKRKWVRETVGLWKGENNGDDEINGNTASLGVGIGFEQGIVGNCFRMGTHTGTIAIPYHAAYNFGSNGFFSFEFYFKYEQFATAWIRFGCHIVSDDQFNGYWKRFAIVFKQGSISVGSNGNFPSQVYSNIPYNEFIKLRFMHGSGGRWELFVNDVLQTPSLYSNLPFIDLDDTAWNMRWDPEIYNISKLDEFAIINDRAYTSPSEEYSALYKTGTSDISAWNTADAFGKPRPDYRGSVSIGVHEPISANATLRVKIGGEYYSKKKAVTY